MSKQTKYCLSIAGFDPSGGAGVLADIKTFEVHNVVGFGVCTSITYQNENKFEGVDWLRKEQIIRQIDVLLEKYPIKYFKIGLIENLKTVKEISDYLKKKAPDSFIIWDPILKASAGFSFHEVNETDISAYSIDLLTPNLDEIKALGQPEKIAKNYPVLLKGGHSNANATDVLYLTDEMIEFPATKIKGVSKHGSGCVLSAAILANLANGRSLAVACQEAKNYISTFLTSTDTLLGKHGQVVLTS